MEASAPFFGLAIWLRQGWIFPCQFQASARAGARLRKTFIPAAAGAQHTVALRPSVPIPPATNRRELSALGIDCHAPNHRNVNREIGTTWRSVMGPLEFALAKCPDGSTDNVMDDQCDDSRVIAQSRQFDSVPDSVRIDGTLFMEEYVNDSSSVLS